MPNNWFQFKQFLIRQERCAMKVGTDGVLLGAWAGIDKNCKLSLDIGTGTGVLSLMLAQRNPYTSVDAVELDKIAAEQAGQNFRNSPWKERIRVYAISFQDFARSSSVKYDLIICNPPFYSASFKSREETRTVARHDQHLKINEIINLASSLINIPGRLNLIIPADKEQESLSGASENGFFCRRLTRVKTTPEKNPKRVLLDFSKENGNRKEDELIIEEAGRHHYSREYLELTREFYL